MRIRSLNNMTRVVQRGGLGRGVLGFGFVVVARRLKVIERVDTKSKFVIKKNRKVGIV